MTKAGKPLSWVEETVRLRLQSILGVEVAQLDDNLGKSLPDLKIQYPDRPFAPVEVTTAVDELEMKAVNDEGFEPWTTKTLRDSWTLAASGRPPNWKALRRQAEGMLRQLEDARLDRFDPGIESEYRVRAAIRQAEPELGIWNALNGLAQLGVQQGHAFPRKQGPHTIGVGLAHSGTWGFTAEAVCDWSSSFVNEPKRADNIAKLDGGGSEAHLAILVTRSGAPHAVVEGIVDPHRDGLLPVESPIIPGTITDLWLSVGFEGGDVLHWSRRTDWTRHSSPRE